MLALVLALSLGAPARGAWTTEHVVAAGVAGAGQARTHEELACPWSTPGEPSNGRGAISIVRVGGGAGDVVCVVREGVGDALVRVVDGKRAWMRAMPGPVARLAGIDEGRVAVVVQSGEREWRYWLNVVDVADGANRGAPVELPGYPGWAEAVDGMLVVRAGPEIVGVDVARARVVWRNIDADDRGRAQPARCGTQLVDVSVRRHIAYRTGPGDWPQMEVRGSLGLLVIEPRRGVVRQVPVTTMDRFFDEAWTEVRCRGDGAVDVKARWIILD